MQSFANGVGGRLVLVGRCDVFHRKDAPTIIFFIFFFIESCSLLNSLNKKKKKKNYVYSQILMSGTSAHHSL